MSETGEILPLPAEDPDRIDIMIDGMPAEDYLKLREIFAASIQEMDARYKTVVFKSTQEALYTPAEIDQFDQVAVDLEKRLEVDRAVLEEMDQRIKEAFR